MTTETETLAACPFCGGEVELIAKGKLIAFKCADTSPCIGSWLGTYGKTAHRKTAIAAWNRRTPTPPTTALDALREDVRPKLAGAEPGQWVVRDDVTAWSNWISNSDHTADIAEVGAGWTPRDMPDAEATAAAIVAAVNYLRAGGLDEASALAGEVARLREALREIADLTKRQQLPITAQVHEVARAALGEQS